MSAHIRVLVVDDHPIYRKGLLAALAGEPDVEVAGEAASAEEALQMLGVLEGIGVVLMDLNMPGVGGLAAIGAVEREHPGVRVLVLTMTGGDASVDAALRAGAAGYLVKGANQERIVSAIRSVAAGEMVLGAEVAGHLSRTLRRMPVAAGAFGELSAREREVLELLARGLDNALIARTLFLSEKTVRNNASAIFAKLGAGSRARAVALARDAGFGTNNKGDGPG
ncbi:response regulator transcription factor [Paeniglutamicibacter psychrophenolicus]|uniref:DNA-binding NarL/FixJ family response regulator n=1 Tax=Paeniglutamicibacter psychrophenolicus TaxID=257454 RepID=A0ABS4WDW3_9MICC|nr:response regulator transcription factor [Paeniglutamicibacter psychrophenolicus]MBP2374398.1 DNA-binding NarL/FixJ family response regulator [Paeniglutamicibacter psychrophenolicus]